ncbi:hypothetical protein KA057_02015, partial [Candidatus Gracilibacteria bacterium]|nr:hypothetical protein [Candidatus Gracilibacteria bacterium]
MSHDSVSISSLAYLKIEWQEKVTFGNGCTIRKIALIRKDGRFFGILFLRQDLNPSGLGDMTKVMSKAR